MADAVAVANKKGKVDLLTLDVDTAQFAELKKTRNIAVCPKCSQKKRVSLDGKPFCPVSDSQCSFINE